MFVTRYPVSLVAEPSVSFLPAYFNISKQNDGVPSSRFVLQAQNLRINYSLRTDMPSPLSLHGLSLELQEQIIRELAFPDIVFLKMTCRHFDAVIKALTHAQLLQAEKTEFAIRQDVYACRDCLRLRPASSFADNMLKRKKRRYGQEDHKRFCVECGVQPRPRTTRYTRGSHIVIQNVFYVFCIRCGAFKEGAKDDCENTSECQMCWMRTRAYKEGLRQREEEYRRSQERARLKAEQITRRAKRRELLGSDSDSDELPPSPTWSELQLDMIQAEAGSQMNSQKAGSE